MSELPVKKNWHDYEISLDKFKAEDTAREVYLEALSEGINVKEATGLFWGIYNKVKGIG